MLKDRRFWVCGLLFAGLLWLAGFFEFWDCRSHPFPYVYLFHGAVLFAWLSGLYCRWSGRWKPGDGHAWGIFVLLCALLELPMCLVSVVSWVAVGVSLALGIGAVLSRR